MGLGLYRRGLGRWFSIAWRIVLPTFVVSVLLARTTMAAPVMDVMAQISYLKDVLSQAGPALSGVLFVLAGIFYAIGQVLPPEKKANFHTTAINIMIGAVVVGVLSVASDGLATASTHLLSNMSANVT